MSAPTGSRPRRCPWRRPIDVLPLPYRGNLFFLFRGPVQGFIVGFLIVEEIGQFVQNDIISPAGLHQLHHHRGQFHENEKEGDEAYS